MPPLNLSSFKNLWLFVMAIVVWIGCKDPVVEEVDPCDIQPCGENTLLGKLDTLWTSPVKQDLDWGQSRGIFVTEESVLYNFFGASDYGLNFYDFDNGNLWKIWNEYPISYFAGAVYHEGRNRLILSHWQTIVAIDAGSGETFRIYEQLQGTMENPHGQIFGDYFYYSKVNGSKTIGSILRTHIDDFINWETVYTLNSFDVGGSLPNIQSYNLWTDPQSGDEVLVFQHRMAFPNRVDVVGYNMTTGEVIWQHDDLTALGNSNHQQIFILDNKAYFSGGTAFYCFDIPSGEIVWQYDHPSGINSFMYYKTVYAEDENLIIVKDAGTQLYAFHPITGNIVWQTENSGQSASGAGSPSYHNGVIYYVGMYDWTMRLIAVNAADGQLIYAERLQLNYHSQFNGDVAIDPERGVLYASDRYYLMAIKLYED